MVLLDFQNCDLVKPSPRQDSQTDGPRCYTQLAVLLLLRVPSSPPLLS